MPKKLKGGPFSLARYCMLRGKKETRFGSVARANGYNLKSRRTFGRLFWLLAVCGKNFSEKILQSRNYI